MKMLISAYRKRQDRRNNPHILRGKRIRNLVHKSLSSSDQKVRVSKNQEESFSLSDTEKRQQEYPKTSFLRHKNMSNKHAKANTGFHRCTTHQGSPTSDRLSTPARRYLLVTFLFQSTVTQADDEKIPRECTFLLFEPIKFSLNITKFY